MNSPPKFDKYTGWWMIHPNTLSLLYTNGGAVGKIRFHKINYSCLPMYFSIHTNCLIEFWPCCYKLKYHWIPSSICCWSISHILEHEFFCLTPFGQLRAVRKKSGFEFFWATFEGVFFKFVWAKKKFKIFF